MAIELLHKYIKEYKWQVIRWVWKYIKYLIRHIFFVCVNCWKMGLPFAGLFHDISKWTPEEFIPYMLYFYGPKFPTGSKISAVVDGVSTLVDEMKVREDVRLAFDYAWLYHQKKQRHHWQFWLLSPDVPRPNFRLGSHGDVHVYGVDLYEWVDGHKTHIFHKTPETVWTEKPEDTAAEYRLEDDLNNTPVALDMPLRYRKEMLADWRGAGRAITGKNDPKETAKWYLENKRRIVLHPDTRKWVEDQLGITLSVQYGKR